MAIDKDQFRALIIRPALTHINLWSETAEELLMGTAAQESHLGTYIKQLGIGPALGPFQMEPATYIDIWENFLRYKPELSRATSSLMDSIAFTSDVTNQPWCMVYNLRYAAAMARIHYFRVPAALPSPGTVEQLADYWKQHYNTPLGAGTQEEFIHNYRKYV